MIKQMPEAKSGTERRRFERVEIAPEAQVQVFDVSGRKAGVLRQLARGGFMMEPEKDYTKDNKIYNFTIHEPREDIKVTVNARARSAGKDYAGFEFVDLDPAAAVEIGQIIGAYYEPKKD
ncbi:MAG TPA: PilZ domain-containing protein [Candidatus Angelobacter sp.]|nr:PilZ domain-containing protein [Candidatus Angelobacter sp.]